MVWCAGGVGRARGAELSQLTLAAARDVWRTRGRTVAPAVRSADNHDGVILAVVEAKVTDRRLEQVAMLGEPAREVEGRAEHPEGAAAVTSER